MATIVQNASHGKSSYRISARTVTHRVRPKSPAEDDKGSADGDAEGPDGDAVGDADGVGVDGDAMADANGADVDGDAVGDADGVDVEGGAVGDVDGDTVGGAVGALPRGAAVSPLRKRASNTLVISNRTVSPEHTSKYLHPLSMNAPEVIESKGKTVTVTLFDANHCLGLSCFCLKLGTGQF